MGMVLELQLMKKSPTYPWPLINIRMILEAVARLYTCESRTSRCDIYPHLIWQHPHCLFMKALDVFDKLQQYFSGSQFASLSGLPFYITMYSWQVG